MLLHHSFALSGWYFAGLGDRSVQFWNSVNFDDNLHAKPWVPFANFFVPWSFFHPKVGGGDEDCLYLAVHVPVLEGEPCALFSKLRSQSSDQKWLNLQFPDSTHEPLPVMVWLTGGAFLVGGGSWYVLMLSFSPFLNKIFVIAFHFCNFTKKISFKSLPVITEIIINKHQKLLFLRYGPHFWMTHEIILVLYNFAHIASSQYLFLMLLFLLF